MKNKLYDVATIAVVIAIVLFGVGGFGAFTNSGQVFEDPIVPDGTNDN